MESLACTFTLKPSMYRFPIKDQYDKLKNELLNLGSIFSKSLVCELTNSGNLHLHGIISFSEGVTNGHGTFRQFVLERFRNSKVIGFICLKELSDKEGWINYCLKHYFITNKDLYFAPTVMFNDNIHFPKGYELLDILRDLISEDEVDEVDVADLEYQYDRVINNVLNKKHV